MGHRFVGGVVGAGPFCVGVFRILLSSLRRLRLTNLEHLEEEEEEGKRCFTISPTLVLHIYSLPTSP